MATINWVQAASGTWTTAADWAGGVVPGPDDTAVIEAANGRAKYTVSVTTPVSVGGVILDAKHATLSVDSTFTAPSIALEAGILLLDNGTLAGTVAETGGSLKLGGTNDTLQDVTWQGGFSYTGKSTLTISGGLTLTSAGGTGPGAATLGPHVVLDGVSSLDNAAIRGGISTTTLTVVDTPTLTLGSQWSMDYTTLMVGSGELLVNDGVLSNNAVTGGTFTNNGTINGVSTIAAASFTNNGQIDISGVNEVLHLNVQGLQPAGASGVIDVTDQGTVNLVGTLTTSQLNTIFTQQHVTGSGSFDTSITGTLNNAGAMLDVGAGTIFGTFATEIGVITGGTIIDQGGGTAISGTLSTLMLQSQVGTLNTGNYTTLNNVTVAGATVVPGNGLNLNGGTLSGVGTVSAAGDAFGDRLGLVLNGVNITGVNGSGAVTILADDLGDGGASYETGVTVTDAQSVAGYDFQLTGNTGLNILGGAVVNGADVTFANSTSTVTFSYGDENDTTSVTLGGSFVTTVASGTDVSLSGLDFVNTTLLSSMGTFDVAGKLQVGSSGTYTDVNTTGLIDILAGGTLTSGGSAQDTTISNGGTIATASGVIDIATAIANTGLISDAFGGSASTATIGGAISGAGTIAITGAGTLALGGTVATGQVVQFGAGAETLDLTKVAASKGFSGMLDGFAKGDAIALSGETISAAQFSGSSIIATISSGGSIVLATGARLHGALSVSENSGNATLTYSSSEPSLRDWSAGEVTRDEAQAALPSHEIGAGLPRDEIPALDQLLLHQSWH